MKAVFLIAAVVMINTTANGQKLRLNLYSSYVFDDSYDYYADANTYYNGKIKGGVQWGGGLEFAVAPTSGVELLYQYQSTTAPTSFKSGLLNGSRTEDFNLKLNYIMLGGIRRMMASSGKVEGYGGLMAGVEFGSLEAPSTGASASSTNFAWGAKLGANIWASPKIGIKLQAQLLSAASAAGGEYYFSFYGPVVLTSYVAIYQFSLGGGLTFQLGK